MRNSLAIKAVSIYTTIYSLTEVSTAMEIETNALTSNLAQNINYNEVIDFIGGFLETFLGGSYLTDLQGCADFLED